MMVPTSTVEDMACAACGAQRKSSALWEWAEAEPERSEGGGMVASIYIVISLIFAVTGGFKAGLGVALCTLATSALCFMPGARLKQLVWRDAPGQERGPELNRTIGGIVIAVCALALGQWLSTGFSISLLGLRFGGWLWGWFGFALALVIA